MGEVVLAGEGETLGQGVEQLAELQPAHEHLELGRRRSGAGVVIGRPPWSLANSDGSRAKRPWTTTGSGRASGSVSSRARSSMRDTRFTSTASASSARRQACSTRPGPPLLDQSEEPVDLAHLGPRQRRVQATPWRRCRSLAVIGGHAPRARRCHGWRRSPCRSASRPGRCAAGLVPCGDGP